MRAFPSRALRLVKLSCAPQREHDPLALSLPPFLRDSSSSLLFSPRTTTAPRHCFFSFFWICALFASGDRPCLRQPITTSGSCEHASHARAQEEVSALFLVIPRGGREESEKTTRVGPRKQDCIVIAYCNTTAIACLLAVYRNTHTSTTTICLHKLPTWRRR